VNPNRRPYRTKDGYIALLVYTDQQWSKFFELIDKRDMIGEGVFATMTTRADNAPEVYGFVESQISQKSTADWLTLLEDSDLPCAEVPNLEDLVDDEHLVAVDFFREVEHPTEGRTRMTDIPSQWSDSQPEISRLAPNLGEHSGDILQELGYSGEQIEALAANQTTFIQ
jgi:crotonobetainyl-CoA:carnitine CoA-transferase CaiB-like acyl-CoA transferase